MTRLTQAGVDRINGIHTALGKPLVTLATPNPYKSLLTDIADTKADAERNIEVWNDVPMSCWGPVENTEYLVVDNTHKLIVMAGGDIEGLRGWFEIDDLTQEVPDSFPNKEPDQTWETWGVFGDSHKPVPIGNKWYRTTEHGQAGWSLNVSCWALTNLKFLTQQQKDALTPASPL